MESIRLGALDFSAIFPGRTAADAVRETLELAPQLESAGYSRYWLAEHHSNLIAHSCPELLVPVLAGLTKRMHIGTAGILLRFHSPLKVAWNFRLLQAMYAGRIDLGIARGGTSPLITYLLRGASREDDFDARVSELLLYLRGQGDVVVNPAGVGSPEVWMLGKSDRSMRLAAENGTAFCFARFLATEMDLGPLFSLYRSSFKPSSAVPEPRCAIAVAGICARSDEEARTLMPPEPPYSVHPTLVGGQASCLKHIETLRSETGVDEVIFHDMCPAYDDRLVSYRLLAETLL